MVTDPLGSPKGSSCLFDMADNMTVEAHYVADPITRVSTGDRI